MKIKIALIGMPGCGKSAVGRATAKKTGGTYADTDDVFEAIYGKISDFFAAYGEAAFREKERAIIDECARKTEVLSLGGGAVINGDAVQKLKNTHVIFYIEASRETLWTRLKQDATRPLLATGKAAFLKLYDEREGKYAAAADVVLHADGKTVDELVQEISSRL